MRTCEFLVLTEAGEQEKAGRIVFNNGVLAPIPTPKHPDLLKRVMAEPLHNGITSQSNPEAWFNGLPQQYSGTYLRAQFA